MCDSDKGEVELKELFNSDGTDACDAVKKINIDWSIVEDGGALVAEDEEEVWGEGDSDGVEYTGNEGASRETTYEMCVLIAYNRESELEMLCESDICAVVNDLNVGDSATVERVLAYMKGAWPRRAHLGEAQHLKLLSVTAEKLLPEIVQTAMAGAWTAKLSLTNGVIEKLHAIVGKVGWETLGASIDAVLAKVRMSAGAQLEQRAQLVDKLRQCVPTTESSRLAHRVASDLIESLQQALRAQQPNATPLQAYEQALRARHEGAAQPLQRTTMLLLLTTSEPATIERLMRWAENAPSAELKKAVSVLPAAAALAKAVHPQPAAAAAARLTTLSNAAELKVLRSQQQTLESATRGGEPTFSWAMTRATHSNPAIQAFLRSTLTSKTFVLGGGIANARGEASSLSGGSYYRGSYYGGYGGSSSSSSGEQQLVTRGFSVSATAQGTGSNASVAVTKTAKLHEAVRRQRYRKGGLTRAHLPRLAAHRSGPSTRRTASSCSRS